MAYNPVDTKIEDLIVIHPGTYLGLATSGAKISLKSADVANIKGGKVAMMTAANEFGLCNASTAPFGLFFGDGSRPNEVSVVFRGGIYETKNYDTTVSPLSNYALNAALVSNASGVLTLRSSEALNLIVGYVTKTPTASTETLGIRLAV